MPETARGLETTFQTTKDRARSNGHPEATICPAPKKDSSTRCRGFSRLPCRPTLRPTDALSLAARRRQQERAAHRHDVLGRHLARRRRAQRPARRLLLDDARPPHVDRRLLGGASTSRTSSRRRTLTYMTVGASENTLASELNCCGLQIAPRQKKLGPGQ